MPCDGSAVSYDVSGFRPGADARRSGGTPAAGRYLDYFGNADGLSYGLFRFGEAAFLVLDSWEDKSAESPGADDCRYNLDDLFFDEQSAFLEQAVASEPWCSARYRFVLSHGAPYSHYDPCRTMSSRLQKLTDGWFAGNPPKSQLSLWLAGHTHRYSRSVPGTDRLAASSAPPKPQKDGREYCYPVMTVAGPGGDPRQEASAFRVDVADGAITVRAFLPDGRCLEAVTIAPDGAVTEELSLPHYTFPADRAVLADGKNQDALK